MDTYQSICSTLKTSLSDAGLSEKSYYGEQQLKPALLSFLNRLEAIGHKVCGDFNSFGLLCALQHYVPSPIMLPQQGFEPDAQVTFNNAAAFAFRFSSATKDAKIKLTPADYRKLSKSSDLSWVHTYSKVIEEVYSIVSVIEHTVRTLRCLGKGDEATVDFCSDDIATILQARPSEELEQKLRNYDERLLRTQNILIFYGLPIGVGKGESPLKGVTVNLNFAQYREGHMDAPPVAKVFDMEGVYVATTLHSDEVIRIFNTRVHAEDLFVFLAALFKPQVEQAQQGERFPGLGVMIFMIMAGATAFSQIMAFSGVTRGIVALVSGLDVPPLLILIMTQLILLAMGSFMEAFGIMMVAIPIFFPIIIALGFDPIWFGVIFLLNMEMGGTTPPFGLNLFVMKGVAPPEISMGDIYKAGLPFLGCDLIAMALIIAFPAIALWLPGMMIG